MDAAIPHRHDSERGLPCTKDGPVYSYKLDALKPYVPSSFPQRRHRPRLPVTHAPYPLFSAPLGPLLHQKWCLVSKHVLCSTGSALIATATKSRHTHTAVISRIAETCCLPIFGYSCCPNLTRLRRHTTLGKSPSFLAFPETLDTGRTRVLSGLRPVCFVCSTYHINVHPKCLTACGEEVLGG